MASPNSLSICFLCLKKSVQSEEKSFSIQLSTLYFEFISFVRNYLQIAVDKSPHTEVNDGGHHDTRVVGVKAFCEDCSEKVSNICELYKELCEVELRLSTKLGELGIVIKTKKPESETKEDNLATASLLQSLAVQLRLRTEDVIDFRNSILLKCSQKSIKINENQEPFHPSKGQEAGEPSDTEIKEEVESLLDDDDGEYQEQFDSKSDCSESESVAGSDLEVDTEMSSDDDDMRDTQPSGSTTQMKTRSSCKKAKVDKNSAPLADKNPFNEGADEDSSFTENEENSCKMDTDNNEDYVKTRSKRSSPRTRTPRKVKRKNQSKASHSPKAKTLLSSDNMFACEANGCRLYFTSIPQLNSHLETHSTKIHSCSECNRGFLHPETLELHKILHTQPFRGKYPCPSPSCSTKFSHPKKLEFHFNTKHGLGLGCFKCPKCELNLANEKTLTKHLKKHDEATDPSLPITEPLLWLSPPPCSLCGLQFLSLRNLDDHREKIHNVGLQCPICKKFYSNRLCLKSHRQRYHKAETVPKICRYCGKSLSGTKENWNEHVRAFHNKEMNREKPHKCSHCPLRFNANYLLKNHLAKCRKNPEAPKPKVSSKPLPCKICGVVLEKPFCCRHRKKDPKRKANAEKKVHDPPIAEEKEPFICHVCGDQFNYKKSLTLHFNVNHRINDSTTKPFQCHICGNSFDGKYKLNEHLRSGHNDEKKFSCSLCPLKTKFRLSLKYHLRRIHGKEKGKEFVSEGDGAPPWRQWKCRYPSCNQDYDEENELKLHVEEEHQGPNTSSFMCNLCGRNFVNQQRLTRHNEVHSQKKQYKCPVCQKSLSQPSSVKEHLMAIHGVGKEQQYLSCTQPSCSVKVKSLPYLYRHLRMVHGVYKGKPRKKSEVQTGLDKI